MPAWATVVLTLGATALGGGIAIVGTWLQNRHATAEREAAARAQRRQEAGRVLGRVETLLDDLEPMRVSLNLNNTSVGLLNNASERWFGLREELAMFAAGDDSPDVAETSRSLTRNVSNLLSRLSLIVWNQGQGRPGVEPEVLDTAKEDYAKALELTDELLGLVGGAAPK